MTRLRWLFFALAIITGLGLGLYYGWVVSPIEYVDTTPSSLRVDFRADYTLMVAETFDREHDVPKAAQRLTVLGNQAPIAFVSEAINFAQQNNFKPVDIQLLQNLSKALQASYGQPNGSQP